MLAKTGRKGSPLHCWSQRGLVRPLWERAWRLLKTRSIESSCDPPPPPGHAKAKAAQSCPTLRPHGLPLGFSRPESWSGEPFPPPGDLPDPGIEPRSPALQADSLPTELAGKPSWVYNPPKKKTLAQKDTCTPMFTAALFTRAGTQKQTKCPTTDRQIRKM